MTTMNAMAVHEFGPAENLIPTKLAIRDPAPGEVLIRVRAAAVNPADIGMREGRYVWPEPLRMPMVPGYDVAGVVEVGTEAFPAGTAVIGYTAHSRTQIGGYAEYVILPERLVAAAPTKLDWAEAAALPLAGLTAQTALHQLALAPGETLLVNRPGSAVGGFTVELARARGIEVVTGPDEVPDTPGTGPAVDAALDVAGGAMALAAFARVRDGGRYATVVPEFWIPGGQFTPARGIDPVTVFVDEAVGDLAELSHLADAGTLTPHIAATLPLASAAEAHRRMQRGGALGKLVLLP
ncbi:NADPH2:quinone reductase [Catenulispora sp. GAS73]|uniref:NADP-dependent oxidoreductase n=1 Tax=Catenulispora sp. GAS73 TaxID=3156269 RepID=UPI0035184742